MKSLTSWASLLTGVTLLLLTNTSHGSRILGVFPITSLSHQVVYRALMLELAKRGHDIVIITPDPIKDRNVKNYREIDVSFMYEYWNKRFNFLSFTKKSADASVADLLECGNDLADQQLSHPEVQYLISPENKRDKFDLVILEWLFTPAMCGFAFRFDAPYIGVSSLPPFLYGYDSVGNPTHPAYLTDMFLPYTDNLSFQERMHSALYALWMRYTWNYKVLPEQDAIARRHFGNKMPPLHEMDRNVSMLMVTSHFTTHQARPNVPALIELAGLHVGEPKPLPKDLQTFMDGAQDGVIYFSFGTNVKGTQMTQETRQMFIDVFKGLPKFRVLWKFEAELPGVPSNVICRPWFPQLDILVHPKVRAFITQGGLQSTHEARMAGVPMVGIPFFSDQGLNVKTIVDAGIAVKVEFNTITKQGIQDALNAVITDDKYRNKAKKISILMQDLPEKPLDKAIWWIEYVIRHKGAHHLRSSAVNLPLYQLLMLDVGLGILLLVALAIFIFFWVIMRITVLCRRQWKYKQL